MFLIQEMFSQTWFHFATQALNTESSRSSCKSQILPMNLAATDWVLFPWWEEPWQYFSIQVNAAYPTRRQAQDAMVDFAIGYQMKHPLYQA